MQKNALSGVSQSAAPIEMTYRENVVTAKDLNERFQYFEQRLEEAKRKHVAKAPHPRTFDNGYTTETFKTGRNQSLR
jgi:hypothetical protein